MVSMFSSDTKEDWLNLGVAAFNDQQVRTATGRSIVVQVEHGNSGDSKDDILSGVLTPTVWSPGDQSWVTALNEQWQERHPGQQLITEACPGTVYAPVGFAMWRPMAEALGWPDTPIGWDDILALMADPNGWDRYGRPDWGDFKFGHTDPRSSNSGLLLMTALAYSVAGVRDGLTLDMVKSDRFIEAMRTVELHTYHYGNKSRDNVVRMMQQGTDFIHATNTTEAETLKANLGVYGESRFPLAFIFPAEGTFWAEQPYCLLAGDWVSEEQREAAQLFLDFLLDQPQQALAVDHYLRPTHPSVPLHAPFTLANGTDPSQTPASTANLQGPAPAALVAVGEVFAQTRRKQTVILLLDVSSSMSSPGKIKPAADAAALFVERLGPDDEIYVYLFGDSVVALAPSGRVGDVSEELAQTLRTIIAGGQTSLYEAICQATTRVADLRAADEAAGDPRLYGIVLLSDGNNSGPGPTEGDMFNKCLPAGAEAVGVRVFTIAYGEDADEVLLTRIANHTQGKFYAADPTSILDLLLDILFQ
jgi:Ca-activated chloride channel family protein